jgi:uncharacterized delta-60 repeat protein
MLKNRTMVIGAALVGAVLTGVLIGNWNRLPSTLGLHHAASANNPKTSLRLLSPGILSIALESGDMYAGGLALQRDGTIVVGATTWVPASDKGLGVVLRLTSHGRLTNPAVTLLADTETIVSGVSTAPDGAIVVVGYGSGSLTHNRHFRLARLLPYGVLDPTFGRNGMKLADMRSSIWVGDAARALALQDDGRIVVTGSAGYARGPLSQAAYCATARFNQNGRLDGSFGDKGRVLTLLPGKTSGGGVAVFIAPDGEIIVAGNASTEGVRAAHHIAVLRYLPSGAPDLRFGLDGAAELEMEALAWGAALDSQGRIVVVGTEWLSPTSTRFLIARFDSSGNIDQSFGATGTVSLHDAVVSQTLRAATLQQDGKIVAVGTFGWHSRGRSPEPGKRDQIAVVRLDANGALDKSFAGGGLLLMASPRYVWGGNGIAIQPDGKLLIVGDIVEDADDGAPSRPAIVLVRLRQDGTPDADFGSGVDTP